MNKQECLVLLSEIEKLINSHVWEGQCETETYLNEEEMRDYLPTFSLPEAEGIFDNVVYLPVGWMDDEDTETSDYKEVANRYLEVYDLLKVKASQEMESMAIEQASEESAMNRDYWSSVL